MIGGGPAGSAAALALTRAGAATLVVERVVEPGWKVGETLAPSARSWLESEGLWDRFLADGHLPVYANRSVWGSAEAAEHDFIFDPYGPGWHLDRSRFDEMLRAAASDMGATVRVGDRVVRAAREPGAGWRLALEGPRGACSMDADFLIDATGRSSWLARSRRARRRAYDRLVGIAALVRAPDARHRPDSVTLVEATEGGWWYSAPVPASGGPTLVVVYFSDADLVPARARQLAGWCALLARSAHTRRRVEGFPMASGPRSVSAASSRLEPIAGDGWVAAGDAAATHDPLSSQGISTALASGRSVARAVLGCLNGDDEELHRHVTTVNHAYARYLIERTAYYRLERRWSLHPFWLRRSSVPREPYGGPHERADRLLRHSPRTRSGQGREQSQRVLPRA